MIMAASTRLGADGPTRTSYPFPLTSAIAMPYRRLISAPNSADRLTSGAGMSPEVSGVLLRSNPAP